MPLTRLIIVVSFILLTVLGVITGVLLTALTISIPFVVLLVTILIYFIAVVSYPHYSLKRKMNGAAFYWRQKTCDAVLAFSTFCLILFFANRPETIINYTNPLNAAIPAAFPKDSLKTYASIDVFSRSLRDENGKSLKWKEKKKLLKIQVKAIKKADNLSKGDKVGLIILSVVAALGLIYLVAALACTLSCNGSEAAAVILGIGGVALVIFLFILALKAIKRSQKKTEKPEEPAKTG